MDPSQVECLQCPLYDWQARNPLPEGCEFAWSVAKFLSGPGIERFGLRDHALELLDLDTLDEGELLELIELLNAVVEGDTAAWEEINKPKKTDGKGSSHHS